MKYLQNTMDYKHGGNSTAAGAATVDLSYVGLQMSELQQMEAQMNAELNITADAGTVDTTTCDSGASAAAASSGGSVSSGSVL